MSKVRHLNKKHFVILSVVYFLVFLCSFLLIDYYANGIIGFKIGLIISAILGIISAYFHSKSRVKTQADKLAKEIEEII